MILIKGKKKWFTFHQIRSAKVEFHFFSKAPLQLDAIVSIFKN
jgi:hypothetical protein